MADLSALYPLLAASVSIAFVSAAAKVVSLLICLRGTKPPERPEIVRALADLFRSSRHLKRGGCDSFDNGEVSKPVDTP